VKGGPSLRFLSSNESSSRDTCAQPDLLEVVAPSAGKRFRSQVSGFLKLDEPLWLGHGHASQGFWFQFRLSGSAPRRGDGLRMIFGYASLFEVIEPRLRSSTLGFIITIVYRFGAIAPVLLGTLKGEIALRPSCRQRRRRTRP
jgi:hypothetical protein